MFAVNLVLYLAGGTAAVQFDFKPDLPLPPVDNPFERVWNSSIAFADVDDDNDSDVLITGEGYPRNPVLTVLLYINDKHFLFGSDNSVSMPENTASTTPVLTVTDTDADVRGTITYSISSGADKNSFDIDPSSGDLTFKKVPDFESPSDRNGNNIYKMAVKAGDDGESSGVQILTITITDVNDNDPEITSDNTKEVAENAAAVLKVTAEDADAGTTIAYPLSSLLAQRPALRKVFIKNLCSH